jgi:hypothetical protein
MKNVYVRSIRMGNYSRLEEKGPLLTGRPDRKNLYSIIYCNVLPGSYRDPPSTKTIR